MNQLTLKIILLAILSMNLSSTRALDKKLKHRGKLFFQKNDQSLTPPTLKPQPPSPSVGSPAGRTIETKSTTHSAESPSGNRPDSSSFPNLKPETCQITHSIETWVQITNQHSPAATQNGVYFISDFRDVPQLFFLKTPKSWPTQISFLPEGISSFKLSPKGTQILLTSQVGGDEQYDLYLWENNSVHPLIVDRNKRIESFEWGPDSKWFLFTSNSRNKIDMDLYRWDLSKGSSELLMALEGNHVVTDISPDGKWALITRFRSVTDSDVLLFNLTTKEILNVTENLGLAASKGGVFTKNSQSIFYISDKNNGMAQAFLTEMKKPTASKLMTSGSDEVEELFMDPSRRKVIFLKNHEGYSKFEGISIDSAGQRKSVLSLPKDDRTVIRGMGFASGSKDSPLFFSQTSSLYPAQVFSWQNNHITQWTDSSGNILRKECLVQEELIHYPAIDGKKIPAFLYRPKGPITQDQETQTKPIPFLIFIHGGPESQYRPYFNKIFHYFLERGYGILAPNVRGSTGYGREYTLLDNYKLRINSVQDGIDSAKWLIDQRLAHKDKLGVYGGSYGGFMVLSMIENAPDLFSAASESVGISNFVTFLKNTKPYRRALREVEYGPLADEEFLLSISPVTHINKIKTPLLIFHGANDPRVPVTETEQIETALKKKEIPIEVKIFSDEGHGNVKLKNILEQARWMVHFFEKTFAGKKTEGVSSLVKETP